MDQLRNLRLFYLNATFITFYKNTLYFFHLPGGQGPLPPLFSLLTKATKSFYLGTPQQSRTLLGGLANQVYRHKSAPYCVHVYMLCRDPLALKALGHLQISCFVSREDSLLFF